MKLCFYLCCIIFLNEFNVVCFGLDLFNNEKNIDEDCIIVFFSDIQTKILPGVTHWQSPEYFAYFPSNSSVAGFLGEMLSAGINMVGFSWITSPAATELEMIALDWLAKALKLPDEFLSTGINFVLR